jgi:type II secretory pathway component PulF
VSRSVLAAWRELDVGRHKAEWYRMWHAGYRAGLPHQQVFETAGEFRRSPTVERARRHLLQSVGRREGLAQAIDRCPQFFDPFEAALLKLGEESGSLEEILRLLGSYFAAEHRKMQWVKRKMAYPMINGIAALFVAPLPLLVLGSTARYAVVVTGGLVAALVFGGTVLAAAARRFQSRPALVRARLLRALALGIEAGLSLDRAVELGVAAAAHPALSRHVARIPPRQLRGQPLGTTFAGSEVVPHEMVAALNVAHETGNYRDTLQKLAELYDGELLAS